MSPAGVAILPQIWIFFIVALPLFAYSRSAVTDSTCSTLDVVPATGEALLQWHAKLEQSVPEQPTHVKRHLSHGTSLAQRTATQSISTLMALIGESGSPLPRGATELFNDQLCKVSAMASRTADTVQNSDKTKATPAVRPLAEPLAKSHSTSQNAPDKDALPENEDISSSASTRVQEVPSLHSRITAPVPSKAETVAPSHQAIQKLHKSTKSAPKAKKTQSVLIHPPKKAKKPHTSQIEFASWPRPRPAWNFENSKLQDSNHSFRDLMMEGFPDEPTAASINAPLDETGYREIAKLQDDDEMKVFIRRVAQSCNMKVIDEGGLNGVVPFMSGTNGSSSFNDIKATLFAALLARSKDHWVAVKNSTDAPIAAHNASLDLMGYVQVRSLRNARQMVTFVKRMVESMGIKIVDAGGFDGLMGFYSKPDDSESFQRLVGEIKKAAYDHSWAELD